LSDINLDSVEETRSLLSDKDVTIVTHKLNVANRQDFYAYADEVVQTFGQVNMVFNNAGVTLLDKIDSMSYEDFEWLMDINFWGVVYGTKAFLPNLLEADEAHVINISSLFGLISLPSQAAYNASKFAVRGFTESLKMELVHTNVGVSCVHPGGIQTSIVDNSRISEESMGASRQDFKNFFAKQAITTSEQAASIILDGVKNKKRRILVGKDAKAADRVARWFPNSYEKKLNLEGSIKRRSK